MTHIRREIVIAIVEDIDTETIGIEVTVPDGMTTLEAIGLMEIGKTQHLQSKHNQGPSVYQEPAVGPCSISARALTIGQPDLLCELPHGHIGDHFAGAARWNTRAGDSCTCTIAGPHPDCPVHHGRRARGPQPPPVGPGCVCDGSGRTCPRHGAVI